MVTVDNKLITMGNSIRVNQAVNQGNDNSVTGVTITPCNPSTVGGQTATRISTGACTAFLPLSAGQDQTAPFVLQCMRIHGKQIRDESSITCTFPST